MVLSKNGDFFFFIIYRYCCYLNSIRKNVENHSLIIHPPQKKIKK